ncbi:MAG: hypothetical protein Tsb002_12660 [Wenzhouxiangellaceae bacterium]
MLMKMIFSLSLLCCSLVAHATWSVVFYDSETQEVGVGSATCISNAQIAGFDLLPVLAVVVAGEGGGAAQSAQDINGTRRQTIAQGIINGLSASAIRDQLIQLPGTGSHQHGIAGAGMSSATHTGANTFPHASGVEASIGNLHYAIQGNILTGQPVVTMAEQALLNTPGDLPTKLMAAMEAARDFGGDGRCSCPGPDATACGSPPASFDKSAHVGFMILSRFGDSDGAPCSAGGCANGDYYLRLNVADQAPSDPDPVDTLRTQFDAFQSALENRPDAIQSSVSFTANASGTLLQLTLFDWRGIALGAAVNQVDIAHSADSAMQSTIGTVIDNGDGSYQVQLNHDGFGADDDRFLITIDDGIRSVVIPPNRATLTFPTLFADSFES